jgi:phosphomannomutase/phosphoglucomutase
MAKEKKQKTDSASKTKKPSNKLAQLCLVFSAIVWLIGGAVIAGIHFSAAEPITALALEKQQNVLAESVAAILEEKFNSINQQLKTISTDADIYNALIVADADEIALQEENLQAQFPEALSLRVIPWDHLGTSGIKQKGIELRNTIEYALITKAAALTEDGRLSPEVYQHDKKWLTSFAVPIISVTTKEPMGIILLTLKPSLFSNLLKNPALSKSAQLDIKLAKNKQSIFKIGSGQGVAKQSNLPFDSGLLLIKLNLDQSADIKNTFTLLYIIIASATVFLSVLLFIFYRFVCSSIQADSDSITQYINSLQGLHEPKKPQLAISLLQAIIPAVTKVAKGAGSSAVTDRAEQKSALHGSTPPTSSGPAVVEEAVETFHFDCPEIFKDYDIRGLASSQLSNHNVSLIGKAIGSELIAQGQTSVVLGRDSRESSPAIAAALTQGVLSTGCDVINIGEVTTPMSYYAGKTLASGSSLMITGSHNGDDYNGIKTIINHHALAGEDIQALLTRIQTGNFSEGEGNSSEQEIKTAYSDEIADDIITAKTLKVLIDTNSQLAAELAADLLQRCDCEVKTTQAMSNSKDEVLQNLSELMLSEQCDLGIAFDSDADRLMAVTNSGAMVSGDQLIMLFTKDIVTRNPGASVVFDVKCSREVSNTITQSGGRAIMHKAGHSNIKNKMHESDAIFGGELSGHFYFTERWHGFDDGVYSALRLVELLSASEQSFDERLAELPQTITSEEYYINVANEEDKERIVAYISDAMSEQKGEKITIDGFRIEFDAGWGLVRPSNTEKAITLRFEAKSEDLLGKLQALFKAALLKAEPTLTVPF